MGGGRKSASMTVGKRARRWRRWRAWRRARVQEWVERGCLESLFSAGGWALATELQYRAVRRVHCEPRSTRTTDERHRAGVEGAAYGVVTTGY